MRFHRWRFDSHLTLSRLGGAATTSVSGVVTSINWSLEAVACIFDVLREQVR